MNQCERPGKPESRERERERETAQLCLHLVCVCLCVCARAFTLNVLCAYVTPCSTWVWERDAAVVGDLFDSTHRAARLHLFITQHMPHVHI